tara:strand:+ start:22 stop:369 length:348 start_codon:yes stop_codon:yes gene_type:complete
MVSITGTSTPIAPSRSERRLSDFRGLWRFRRGIYNVSIKLAILRWRVSGRLASSMCLRCSRLQLVVSASPFLLDGHTEVVAAPRPKGCRVGRLEEDPTGPHYLFHCISLLRSGVD